MNPKSNRMRMFHITLLVTLILLILQYISGMLVNLYIQFPSSLPGSNAWGWSFTHSSLIQIHVYLGTLLLVLSLVAILLSIMVHRISGIVASSMGFAMIIFAWLSGIWFLSNGQQSASSLWMSLGFIGALIAYMVGYFKTRPNVKAIGSFE